MSPKGAQNDPQLSLRRATNKPKHELKSVTLLVFQVCGYSPKYHIPGNRVVPRDTEPKDCRLDRQSIRAACEASLRRLQTDYIDLYQLHW